MIRIVEHSFDPEFELAAFRRAAPGAGAIASFIGCVRAEAGVRALVLEHYPMLTERMIQRFVDEALVRFSLRAVCVVHRVGAMEPGDPIVLVACASAHRKDAFAAVEFLMDYLKTEAPFWKRELGEDVTRWIEPGAHDYESAAQWRRTESEGDPHEP